MNVKEKLIDLILFDLETWSQEEIFKYAKDKRKEWAVNMPTEILIKYCKTKGMF